MKRRAFSLAAQVSVLSIVPTLFWGLWWEPASLTVEQIPLELPRLTVPLRIAALGDLHVGSPNVGLSHLCEIVARVNAEAPDLVLFTGDFMVGTPENPEGMLGSHFIEPKRIAAELEHLRAPYGIYAVLGNHDWWSAGKALTNALQRAGIRVLENQAVAVETPEQRVWLGGIADLWTRTPDIAGTLRQVEKRLALRGNFQRTGLGGGSPDDPVILFTHNPDIFGDVPERVDLLVAGHTHGGQVSLPWFGTPVPTSETGLPIARGYWADHGTQLFITSGIGTTSFPFRMGVTPEIVLLNLAPPARSVSRAAR